MPALSELLPNSTTPVSVRRAPLINWRLLHGALTAIKSEIPDPASRRLAALDLLSQAVLAEYVAWISCDASGRQTFESEHVSATIATKEPRAAAANEFQRAVAAGMPSFSPWEQAWNVVVGQAVDSNGLRALAAIVPATLDPAMVGAALQLVTLTLFANTDSPNPPASTDHASTVAVALELTVRLADARNTKAAAKLLCDLIQRQLKADHVAVGLVKRSGMTVEPTALSDIAELDQKSATSQLLGDCLTESLPQTPFCTWSEPNGIKPFGLGHWQNLAELWKSTELAAVRFADRKGDAVAVCLVASTASVDARAEQFLQLVGQIAGPMLRVLERASQGRKLHELKERVPTWFRGRKACALAAVVALPLIYPWCQRTTCPVVLEPLAHRIVAAPFEGVFDRSLVMPGDRVEAGQLLGRMDGRELRARLAGCEADLVRAGKSRDVNLAAGKLAGAQIDRLEMDRLEYEREVFRRRLEQLEICSPIAGVVVTGDLRRYESATLKVGEKLFEIAPLDKLTAELAVAEEDLEYVAEKAEVTVRLDAVPGDDFEGRVERIRPRGELRDNRQVFVAELTLNNVGENLRPGMKGSAVVIGPRAPGAWLLLRKPWYATLRFLGW